MNETPPIDWDLAVAHLLPGADYRRADDYATLAATWHDARPLPSEVELIAAAEDARIAGLVDRIKAEAGERILAPLPIWQQNNLTARALELERQERLDRPLDADETAELDVIAAAWAWVRSVRAASDAMELRALDGEIFDPSNETWPEWPH